MKTVTQTILTITLALAVVSPFAEAKPKKQGEAAPPVKAVPDAIVKEVLTEALAGPDGEYAAYSMYQAIIEKHGEKPPYTNIKKAELRHIAALKKQFDKYGLPVPENIYPGKVKAPASLIEAAQEGVQAEKRNTAMYDRLLKQVKDYTDLTRVFSNLQRASRENHLPAFQAAETGGGQCPANCPYGGKGWGRKAR